LTAAEALPRKRDSPARRPHADSRACKPEPSGEYRQDEHQREQRPPDRPARDQQVDAGGHQNQRPHPQQAEPDVVLHPPEILSEKDQPKADQEHRPN
jgi:hypothetical protein